MKTTEENRLEAHQQLLGLEGGIVDRITIFYDGVQRKYEHRILLRKTVEEKLVFKIYPDFSLPNKVREIVEKRVFPTAQMAADFIISLTERYELMIKNFITLYEE